MKNLIKLFSVLMMAALIASCATKEDTISNGKTDGQAMTFVFKGLGNGGVTYIATPPENQAEIVDVYMFEYAADESGIFHNKWTSGDPDCQIIQTAPTTQTLTVSGLAPYGVTQKVFYFVANPSPTTDLDATGLTEAEFRELITQTLAINPEGKAELLTTPLLFTGKTGAINPNPPSSTNVDMKRRVARFDIVNEYPEFVIEQVLVSDARIDGFVFGNAVGPAPLTPTSSLEEITNIPDYEMIEGERISQSVFYLYPTTVSETDTDIAIQASVNGVSNLYYLDSTITMNILANYRYKLVVNEDIVFGTYIFGIEYLDWDAEDSLNVDLIKPLEVFDFAFEPDNAINIGYWDDPAKTFNMNESTADTMYFTARNALELSYEFVVIEGDSLSILEMPTFESELSLTYSAVASHACKVTLPVFDDMVPQDITIRLRVHNAAYPEQYVDIFFVKEATAIALNFLRVLLPTGVEANMNLLYLAHNLALFYIPSVGTYTPGQIESDTVSRLTLTTPYNTRKNNIDQGWTMVSTYADAALTVNDYNTTTDASMVDQDLIEISMIPNPNRAGYYLPISPDNYCYLWGKITTAQGDPLNNPITILQQSVGGVTLRASLDHLLNRPAGIEPDQLWVIFNGIARARRFSDGQIVTTQLGTEPPVCQVAVEPEAITPDAMSWTVNSYLGIYEPGSSISDNQFGVRLMNGNDILASIKFPDATFTTSEYYYIIFEYDALGALSLRVQTMGGVPQNWTQVPW